MSETVTIEEARRLVEEERNARAMACLAQVMQVAERHRCRLEAAVYVTVEGRVLARVQAVAL